MGFEAESIRIIISCGFKHIEKIGDGLQVIQTAWRWGQPLYPNSLALEKAASASVVLPSASRAVSLLYWPGEYSGSTSMAFLKASKTTFIGFRFLLFEGFFSKSLF